MSSKALQTLDGLFLPFFVAHEAKICLASLNGLFLSEKLVCT